MTTQDLQLYLPLAIAERGVFTLIKGAWKIPYPDVVAVLLGIYLHENGGVGRLIGSGLVNRAGEFAITIGPLEPGSWTYYVYRLSREGFPDLQHKLTGDLVVHAPSIPSGEVNIPPVYQP